MGSTVSDDSEPEENEGKALGVRFAESRVGRPIVRGLLFITGSFWITVTAVGVLLMVVAFVMWEGVMAGIIGTFGISAVFVGLLGHVIVFALKQRKDERS